MPWRGGADAAREPQAHSGGGWESAPQCNADTTDRPTERLLWRYNGRILKAAAAPISSHVYIYRGP